MMTKTWKDGATWIWQGTVFNNGAVSNVAVILTPGGGNEFELHYASILHDDATASTVTVIVQDDAGNNVLEMVNLPLVQQNILVQVPPLGTVAAVGAMNFPELPGHILISGGMVFRLTAEAIDDTEGIQVSIVGRIWGDVPIITTLGGGAETVTVNTNKVL